MREFNTEFWLGLGLAILLFSFAFMIITFSIIFALSYFYGGM